MGKKGRVEQPYFHVLLIVILFKTPPIPSAIPFSVIVRSLSLHSFIKNFCQQNLTECWIQRIKKKRHTKRNEKRGDRGREKPEKLNEGPTDRWRGQKTDWQVISNSRPLMKKSALFNCVCLFVNLPVCLSVCLFVYLFVFLSFLSVFRSDGLSVLSEVWIGKKEKLMFHVLFINYQQIKQ